MHGNLNSGKFPETLQEFRGKPLQEAFYRRDALNVAPDLLGKRVCRKLPDGQIISLRILETEAYRGEEDGACHARFGRTLRTETMYQKGGFAYVYMIYGLHFLMNVVTGDENHPQAVLIRAMEKPFDGPAKWTKFMQINRSHNGIWLPESDELWLEDDGVRVDYFTAPRVGIQYAEPYWRDINWRFIARDIKEENL